MVYYDPLGLEELFPIPLYQIATVFFMYSDFHFHYTDRE